MEDQIGLALAQWEAQYPEVNVTSIAVLGRVFQLATVAMRTIDHTYHAHGLQQGEFDVLAVLYRSGSPYALKPRRLTEALPLSPSAITNRVDRLQRAGLITRRPNLTDGRSMLVSLTPEGLHVVKKALPLYIAELERLLQPLSPSERQQLAILLKKLLIPLTMTASTGTGL